MIIFLSSNHILTSNQGRTLEEINEIFDDSKPVKKSLEKRTHHEAVLNATLK
jgi:hypothetical protein